jgi:Ni/Co efflux regulator RcnB
MLKPIFGPSGLRLRECILLSTILASMALSACMAAQEKEQRAEKFERLKAKQIERVEEAQRQEAEKKAADKAALQKWVKDNDPYVRGLCASDPGAEHQFAWDSYGVAVSTDTQRASEAAKAGKLVLDCEELRIPKTSAAEFSVPILITAIQAEHTKRDAWLSSPVGMEYQRHLCSLSGDERQQALANAAQLHGIIPREAVTDEAKARSHGFAILDCSKEQTSAAGYTWSNTAQA